ncbi:Phage shock protein C, PspC [Bacillus cereus]|nr:Phage shock protein C, PspC [Bacillus cereus]HDR7355191.1 PspC domain-containing protein [Bacillus wiedmannii]HDR7670064.1 PspC domain-containing protein [Bacillus wiedmannii]HDR7675633.1 PspC domain-containing protein [Bacillus wiedmannii]HDR7943717.1 PspC domain-containing protein [Bacillus wiedmannii]
MFRWKKYKSTQDKQVSGVLGSLSDKYGIDVSILRIVTALPDFLGRLTDIVKKVHLN